MTTEAEKVADLAVSAAGAFDIMDVPTVMVPDGYAVQQFESLLQRPVRPRGQYVAQDQPSFRALVSSLRDADDDDPQTPRTYVDKEKRTARCVLNDASGGRPGHRDWSVFWQVKRSLAWDAWVKLSTAGYVSQRQLAEFLEDWRQTIVRPDSATLMELATDMEGHRGAQFRSGQRLKDGTIQIAYVEEVRATTKEGQIEVPGALSIFVPVFDGEPPVEIQARLRWALDDGKVKFHVVLPPVEEVEQQQMLAITERLREWGETEIVLGAPASA